MTDGKTEKAEEGVKRVAQYALKIGVSILIVIVFAAVGALLAELRPWDVPGDLTALRTKVAGKKSSEDDVLERPPVPPDTDQVLHNEAEAGEYFRYESRLSMEGLWAFYTTELPAEGWERDESMAKMQGAVRRPGEVLSFIKGEHRSIIYLKPEKGLKNYVTVLLMGPGGPDQLNDQYTQMQRGELR
ncbi:MAG: hypothetical protein ACOCR1_02415 [Planctomycetota bacterium]